VDADEESAWSVEELKAGKPLLVYWYVDGLDETNGANDPNLKFARSFEFGGLGERVVEELNANWRCKKVGIELEADRKQEKNQARIEFWSFTGTRMGDITLKEAGRLAANTLKGTLKAMRAKNAEVCGREIKRIEALQKAREKAEKDAAEKETAAK
jgi:hypothetical protein